MSIVALYVAYLCALVFLVAVIARVIMWLKMPMHVRWELYPVAHEGKRAAWGGSYLEEVDWWKKPRVKSRLAEIKAMAAEIVFLVALREHNKKLWYRSFPFHFGIYLMIAAAGLLGFKVILNALSVGALASLLQGSVIILGVSGMVLNLVGALGLLHRRLTDPDLKDVTHGADLINLALFAVVMAWALATYFLADPAFVYAEAYLGQFLLLGGAVPATTGLQAVLPAGAMILIALLAAYVPLTHMSHFIGKYFAYHAIRWNDEPILNGSKLGQQVVEVLGYPVSWAAPHIKGDGKKTWADVATEEIEK